jgi:hypothetical protein
MKPPHPSNVDSVGIIAKTAQKSSHSEIDKKRPPSIEPWWPSFCGLKCFLNISINNKPVFFSEVVIYKKKRMSWKA